MIRVLAWKECREQSTVWVALAGLTALLIAVLVYLLEPAGRVQPRSEKFYMLVEVGAVVAFIYGLVCGAMLLSGERESRTLTYLDFLTARRGRIWKAKFVAGLALTLTHGLAIAAILCCFTHMLGGEFWLAAVPTAAAVLAFLWGLMASSLTRNVLAGAGLGAVFCALNIYLASLLADVLLSGVSWVHRLLYGQGGWSPHSDPSLHTAVSIPVNISLGLVGLVASWKIFCRPDLKRRADAGGAALRRSLAWLMYRQLGVVATCLLTLCVIVSVSLRVRGWTEMSFLLGWAILGTALGVVCGGAIFASEQSGGGRTFLANQRLSANKVWGAKVLTGLGLTALIAIVGLIIVRGTGVGPRSVGLGLPDRQFSPTHTLAVRTVGRAFGSWHNGTFDIAPVLFLVLWPLYGFAIGQWCVMAMHRPAVAMVIAILSSAVAFLWWPSLFMGDVYAWQALLPPAILIVTTRLAYWPWATGAIRLPYILGGGAVLGALLLAGGIAYRFLEVPDVGEPFDVERYLAEFPSGEANKAGRLVQRVAGMADESWRNADRLIPPRRYVVPESGSTPTPFDLRSRQEQVLEELADFMPWNPAARGLLLAAAHLRDLPVARSNGLGWYVVEEPAWLSRVANTGWRLADDELGRKLDHVFDGEWAARIRELPGLPLGVVEDPRSEPLFLSEKRREQYALAVTLLRARASQLQARGDSAAALDRLAEALAVTANLENKQPMTWYIALEGPVWEDYHSGHYPEPRTLDTLDVWLENLGPRVELLRRALEMLRQYEHERPGFADHVKAGYVLAENTVLDPARWAPDGPARAYCLSLNVPWEHERQRRIVNAVYAGLIAGAEEEYPVWAAQMEADVQDRSRSSWERALVRYGWRPPNSFWTKGTLESLARLSSDVWYSHLWYHGSRRLFIERLCRLRASELRLALALFQIETGRPAPTLDALVPRYFERLPRDPFTDTPFNYRVSKGERMSASGLTEATTISIRPGQGVIWSVEGGRYKTIGSGEPAPVVFLVPEWPK